jgi:hypothetical protein
MSWLCRWIGHTEAVNEDDEPVCTDYDCRRDDYKRRLRAHVPRTAVQSSPVDKETQ